ncbi:uncharacterized protein A1O5_06154 [Cladophialophora psammophila CBS 110553]|uniref:Uncharacterized protein n=1 Tax=Cladophialophora psammophila CBS 110553 TaxID=1182543 RepID=W9X1G0_9EURO|nr:uncharacterized protein A1O5_06154 [Cladophialophora psammophila CBS 110553]EXJ71160.1 hypothetical protein A1O5_06154 [Cladophialophora psammophila CBS 110553]
MNHVEPSEAINSIFRWYRGAAGCYVYQADVSGQSSEIRTGKADFQGGRWFTAAGHCRCCLHQLRFSFSPARAYRSGIRHLLSR